ncbi:MAG: class C beta-lactamase [Undibacterium umbellatum]|uniref:class C beta-lactamase n=1 Tax=Undibacterium umbellatum TaxID=2762300 RepID=UPI003BB71EF6
MKSSVLQALRTSIFFSCTMFSLSAMSAEIDSIKRTVDAAVLPVKDTYAIPGMAVGIYVNGQQYVFNYGLASRADNAPVNDATLFEIGSISKTFTATMATLAQQRGKLALNDKVSDHLVSLKGSSFGDTTLLSLATHTTGGLPLQVPEAVKNDEQLMTYLKSWKPANVQGTHRTYSNISIGLLGVIAAQSLQQPAVNIMQEQIFPAFGMKSSYLLVPDNKRADYAQGYKKDDTPVRMRDDVLSVEAYGVRTTASDLVQFIKANIGEMKLAPEFAQALKNTHTGYFKAGGMTQSLIWELYPYPAEMAALFEGSSERMVFEATPVDKITPPMAAGANVFIHKTGATSGFGAYIAFVPHKKMGIVILANKNFPGKARIETAQKILAQLGM